MAISELQTPLERVLLDHGARIVVRHGRRVAADFGSVASEMAVCTSSVGLTDRFGRVTLDVRGAQDAVLTALERLDALAGRAWAARRGPNRAVVRCEPDDDEACRAALDGQDVLVIETTADYAALGLIGPRAADVLRDARLDEAPFAASVLTERGSFEVLVPRPLGPDVWAQLLRCGAAFGIACVGYDALEHLAVARHLAEL
jgi:glycine cleavage system aminomethyltransferase T